MAYVEKYDDVNLIAGFFVRGLVADDFMRLYVTVHPSAATGAIRRCTRNGLTS